MPDIRSTPDLIDAAWLTDVLRRAGVIRSARVTDLSWAVVGAGMLGDSVRFSLTYDRDEGAPASLVGKFPAADVSARSACIELGLYLNEVRFYQDIAPTIAVNRPDCYFAEIDVATGDFTLLLEDLSPARGGDQLKGCSLDDARQAMIQAAAMHGPRWCDPALKDIEWMRARPRILKLMTAGFPGYQAEFHRRYDGILEPEYMAVADRYAEVVGDFFGLDYQPWTLMHFDYRLDNMLFDARGGKTPLAILDWQSLAYGAGALDVSYFLGAGLSIELRRKHERELLELYLEELRRHGVRDYDFDALWRDYRITALQGVSTSIHASSVAKRTERGDQMFLTMARGACAQAIDLDTFSALAAVL